MGYTILLESCWDTDPEARPTFHAIVGMLDRVDGGRSTGAVAARRDAAAVPRVGGAGADFRSATFSGVNTLHSRPVVEGHGRFDIPDSDRDLESGRTVVTDPSVYE